MPTSPATTTGNPVPDKLIGVLAMGVSVGILFILPWIDTHPIKSIRYRSFLFKLLIMLFAITFVFLGYLGTQKPTVLFSELGFRFGELYFSFFLVLWMYSRERSSAFYKCWFVGLLVLIVGIDAIRAADWGLHLYSALIPLIYYIIFLLRPFVTSLNESRPVPGRVIW